jgi:hypothetical protein
MKCKNKWCNFSTLNLFAWYKHKKECKELYYSRQSIMRVNENQEKETGKPLGYADIGFTVADYSQYDRPMINIEGGDISSCSKFEGGGGVFGGAGASFSLETTTSESSHSSSSDSSYDSSSDSSSSDDSSSSFSSGD